MREDSIVRIGFAGCGGVADLHAAAVMRCEAARLAAVSDLNGELAADKARRWGARAVSFEELCAAEDIDAIYILTPMETHVELAAQAMESGKHVLVEKPVSLDTEGIRRLIRLARERGVSCIPGHSYLYLPELARMKRLLGEGKIGRPLTMFMSEIYRMPDELVRRYHGPSIEVLCHQLYLMIAWLGVPKRLHAFGAAVRRELFPDGDEQLSVNAEFAGGALAHLHVSWAGHDETSDPWTFKVKLLGTEGGMHFSRRDQVGGGLEEQRDYPLYLEMFEQETDYFVRRCLLGGEPALSTMEDALLAMQLAEAVRRSFRNGTVETIEIE
ncbi:Gfo/Idh/MocA family oxidoreductase [Paenibacillus cisolokensis]|uniref:Gfo/Idh/MocA family protein n=1 Tax=Paenibacillus cisolokensis TaxID=1658519 RepID=UPI003D2CA39C